MKLKFCVICGNEIEIKLRSEGNARKTCSIECRDQREKERVSNWFKDHPGYMEKYRKSKVLA